MTADYRLVLANRSATGLGGTVLDDILTIGLEAGTDGVAKWTETLNAAGTLEFTLPMDSSVVDRSGAVVTPNLVTPANFAPGQRELHLYRNGGSGEVLVWAGHLWLADVKAPWVRFMGAGWYETLRHRQRGEDFYRHAAEQIDIAWELIDDTQQESYGNIGLTRGGGASSGVRRTLALCAEERTTIADAIEDLASADDGFDFSVLPNKVWQTYTPHRGNDNLYQTVHLDAATNVQDLAYTVDATTVENEVAGIGAVQDCEPVQYYRTSDETSQGLYGLMQGSLSRGEMKYDQELLIRVTNQQLAMLRSPRHQPVVQLHAALGGPVPTSLGGTFDIGDTISLAASRGYATFAARPYRVLSYSVTIAASGDEEIEVTLDGATA